MIRREHNNIFEKIAYIALCFALIFAFSGNGSAINFADNPVFFLIAILTGLAGIVWNKKFCVTDPIIFWFLVWFMVYTVITGALSPYTDPGTFKTMVVAAGLVLVIVSTNFSWSDVKKIETSVIIGSSIFSILVLFFGHYYLSTGTGKYTYIQSFGDNIIFEPNFLAFFITVGFEITVIRLMQTLQGDRKFVRKLGIFLIASVQMLAMFRTGSRLSLVATVLFVVMYILFSKNKKLKKGLLAIVLVAIIFLFIAIVFHIIPESMVKRLFQVSYLDGSNLKRIADWLYGIKAMLSSVFGYGPVVTSNVIKDVYGFYGDAHNTFISIGIFYGIAGFILFILMWLHMMIQLASHKDYEYFSMLISVFFQANILPLQCTVMFWLFMLLVFMKIYLLKKENIVYCFKQ